MSSAIFTHRRPDAPESGSGRLAWRGWTVRGNRGETLGKIEEIYVAEETATPDWALVRSDGPGASTSFLPRQGSRSEGNEVIVEAIPRLISEHPGRYDDTGLAQLAREMHARLSAEDTAEMQESIYRQLPTPAMTPSDAFGRLVDGEVELVPLDALHGAPQQCYASSTPPESP